MKQSSNFANFSKLFLGNTLGQVITLALYPYIARQYSPKDFAQFGFVLSLTLLLSVFATGQFHVALLNPEDEEEAKKLVGLATLSSTLFTVLSLIIFLFIDKTLVLVSIYLLFYCLFEIYKVILIREKSYTLSASNQLIFRFSSNGLKLIPAFTVLKSTGLVVTEILGLILGTLSGIWNKKFNIKFDINTFKKYSSFPAFHSFGAALSILISDFPILFWSMKYSQASLGFFVMSQKLLLTPAAVVANSVQSATVHDLIKSENPKKFFLHKVLILTATCAFGIIGFYMIGDYFIRLLLGPNWDDSTGIFKFTVFLIFPKILAPLSQGIFVLKNLSKWLLLSRSIQAGLLFLITTFDISVYESLVLYITVTWIAEIAHVVAAYYLAKTNIR